MKTLLLTALLIALPAASRAAPPKKTPARLTEPPIVAPTPIAAPPPPPTLGKEVRTITLTEKQASRVQIVRTAPSYPTTIEFPEPFASSPTCGDCVAGDKADKPGAPGLFRLDVFEEPHYLTIKPRAFSGLQPDGSTIPVSDFLTVLTVRLRSITITIQVEYTDDLSKADPRVVFVLPDRGQDSAFVAAEKKKLEEQFTDRLQKATTQALLRSLTEPHSCSPLSEHKRADDLLLEARELCIFGSRYYVRFTVENRSRTSLDLAEPILKAGADAKSAGEPPELERYLSTDHLPFQTVSSGVLGLHLGDGEAAPRFFQVIVSERGGKGRTVQLDVEP
jgi:hypothetical protein